MCNNEATMMAVMTTGNGGYDKLEYRAVPIPAPGPNEVLLRVLAAGVNNTDINTRLGWYSSSVTERQRKLKKLMPNKRRTEGGKALRRSHLSKELIVAGQLWRSAKVLFETCWANEPWCGPACAQMGMK